MPSYDLGALGPQEGQAVLYHWRWYYSMPSLSLWVVLLMAAVMPRANRRMEVLLIIAPAAVIHGGWLAILNWVLPSVAARDDSINMFFLSLVMGSALLWLLGHLLSRGTWCRTLLGALGITVGVAILTTLAFRFEISAYTVSVIGGLSIPMLALVMGYTMAGHHCRRLYTRARFAFWLAVWMVIPVVLFSVVFITLQCTFLGWPNSVAPLLGFVALAGLVMGLVTFVISLPFLLIGWRSPVLRERLFSCLRLPAAPGLRDNVTVAEADQQR